MRPPFQRQEYQRDERPFYPRGEFKRQDDVARPMRGGASYHGGEKRPFYTDGVRVPSNGREFGKGRGIGMRGRGFVERGGFRRGANFEYGMRPAPAAERI